MTPKIQSDQIKILNDLLTERYSCRAFQQQSVPDDKINTILTMAQQTASWCNSQSWHVTITKGVSTERFRNRLMEHVKAKSAESPDFPFPREYRGKYLERRRESGFQLYNALGISRGDKTGYEQQGMQNFALFGAPHVAIITTDEALGTYGAVDCGGYVSNFMIAAKAYGVACVAQAALSRYAGFVKQELGISNDRLMVCAISFGYSNEEHPANSYRTSRAPLNEVIHWVSS